VAHPLDDPRAKIRRAETHLGEFDREWKLWLKSNPYAVLDYPNADKTEWTFHVHRFNEAVKPESDTFGIVVGDYVHALRSALDQLVWKLVTEANGITPKNKHDVVFPILTTHPRDFWAKRFIKDSELTLEQALMIEGFQPYRAIDGADKQPLAHLAELWNADKHRLINPVKVTIHESGPVFGKNADAGEFITKEWDSEIALEGDAEIAWATTAPPVGSNPKVYVQDLPVDVVFGEVARPVENIPNLLTNVREIVENCAHFFK
jgi:hypothetical protein